MPVQYLWGPDRMATRANTAPGQGLSELTLHFLISVASLFRPSLPPSTVVHAPTCTPPLKLLTRLPLSPLQLPPIMSMPIREDPQDLGPRYPHGPLPPIPGSSSPQNGNRSLPLQLAGVLNAVVGDGGHGGGVGVGGAAGGAGSVRRA